MLLCALSWPRYAGAVGNGDFDAAGAYPAVARVVAGGRACSASLVTPLWMVTAKHCTDGMHAEPGFDVDECDNSLDPVKSQSTAAAAFTVNFDPALPCGGGSTLCFQHTPGVSGNAVAAGLAGSVNLCNDFGTAQDIAVFQLDQRIPLSLLQPLRLPIRSDVAPCTGGPMTVVGFGADGSPPDGGTSGRRNFKSSGGWGLTSVSPVVGDIWTNYWVWGAETYNGVNRGDSGGPLLQGGRVCGVNSTVNFELEVVDCFDLFPCTPPLTILRSEHASTQASAAQAFFRSMNVVDVYGEFMGECTKGPTAARDVDSDCDTIPDACDPCPYLPDPTYRATGRFGAPFASSDGALIDDDGDGVPNACDNCPTTPNPFGVVPGPLGGPKAPLPAAGCGAANLPVAQHLEQLDGDTDGLGDACDRCALPDPVCCTTDADCNPRADRGVRCRPTVTGAAWPSGGHPCQGGSMCEASLDSDADGIGDRCDNCPRQNNPTQADADADGLGDACDKCAAVSDAAASALVACALPAPAASIAVADLPCVVQTNQSDAACVRLGDGSGACSHGRDADQDGVGDQCDNCKTTPNIDQANCNFHIEVQQGVAFPYVGDACDREPCARVLVDSATLASGPQDDNWVKLRLEPILLPSGAPGAYAISPLVAPRVDVGLRACGCVPPPGTGSNRSAVAFACQNECPFDPSQFLAPGSKWTPVDIVASSESGDPPQGTNFLPGAFLPSSIYPSRPLAAPGAPAAPSFVEWDISRFPTAGPLGTTTSFCKAGFGLTGVLWTSAQQVTNLPAMNTVAQLAHHYAGGTLGEPTKCTPPPPTAVAPCFLCGEGCSSCSLKEMGFLTMAEMEEPGFDPPSHVWGISGAQRFVAEVDDEVRLASAAPGTVLLTPSDGFAHRSDLLGALVRRVGPMTVVGLTVRGDRMSVARTVIVSPPDGDSVTLRRSGSATGTPAAPPTLTGHATVLSSRERSVFVLGGRDAEGGPSAAVWQLALDSGLWFEARVTGPRPGSVAAAVFRSEDRSFYVIDEVKLGPLSMARLLRISLDDLRSTVLGAWPRVKRFDDTYLSVAEDGDLILAASGGAGSRGTTWFTKLDVNGPRLELRWARQEKGHLVAVPVLSRRGLTAWYEGGVARFVDADDLSPRGRWPHTLGDCF